MANRNSNNNGEKKKNQFKPHLDHMQTLFTQQIQKTIKNRRRF